MKVKNAMMMCPVHVRAHLRLASRLSSFETLVAAPLGLALLTPPSTHATYALMRYDTNGSPHLHQTFEIEWNTHSLAPSISFALILLSHL